MNDYRPLIARLEALVKRDNRPDWEDVVRRAEAPENAADVVERRRSRRSYLARRLVPVFLLAVAALVIGMIAPWQHGRSLDSAVAERALVAIGDGPVLHVVMRWESINMVYVNLANGRERPTYAKTYEIWYDSKRHFEHEKIITESDPTSQIEVLQTPSGTWTSSGSGPEGGLSLPPTLKEFLDGYRSALANGSAHVTGTGTVGGHKATWIEFAAGARRKIDAHTYTVPSVERVAIDDASSLPIRLEFVTRDQSNMHSNFEITSIETLPEGKGDFSEPEYSPSPSYQLGHDQVAPITPSAAAQALPGALWAGKSISGLQLSGVSRARLTSSAWSSPETGIELRYGSGSPGPNIHVLWSGISKANNKPSGDYVVLQEAAVNFSFEKMPPDGSVGVGGGISSECFGWLVKNGVYFSITASNRALLLEAARALKPIQS